MMQTYKDSRDKSGSAKVQYSLSNKKLDSAKWFMMPFANQETLLP
jgi:hypothetical protein